MSSAVNATSTTHSHSLAPVLAILVGASVWGFAWYPYRLMAGLGLGGLLAAAATGTIAMLIGLVALRRSLHTFRCSWIIIGIGVASGVTNTGFVWGSVNGHVMRVLLLFYLTPVWTALIARWILGEKLDWAGIGLIVLALFGAGLMLWTPEAGIPLPATAAEWSGLAGGIGFAFNNVLSRLAAHRHPEMRAELRVIVVFAGCAAVAALTALVTQPRLPEVAPGDLWPLLALVLGLATILVSCNAVTQYGLQRLPANRVSLLMLFEIVVAAVSSWWLATETLTLKETAGGLCIIAAGALSGIVHRPRPAATVGSEAAAQT
ncbi:DMT family transporter [Imbroritus primus]|uniref:DMT family transporter n=1 Tax=Imbroritus primus TaxID=3058603 RepID=A0ACD3SRU9_9BURK|nr:DMT family transporter [Burkholderiaceae bacterium PBA]